MSLEADPSTYFVYGGHTLVYSKPGSIFYHILASIPTSRYGSGDKITAQPHQLRQAKLKDFERFKVSPDAYFGTERGRFYKADDTMGAF